MNQFNDTVVRIVITNFADKERGIAALNLGAGYLIEMPFTTRQMIDEIEQALADCARERLLRSGPSAPEPG